MQTDNELSPNMVGLVAWSRPNRITLWRFVPPAPVHRDLAAA